MGIGGLCGANGAEQDWRVLSEGVDDVPAVLFGGRDERADAGEVCGTVLAAEAAGDFHLDLHHAPVAFALIVGEGDGGIAEEAQSIRLAVAQAQEKIVSDPSLGQAARGVWAWLVAWASGAASAPWASW